MCVPSPHFCCRDSDIGFDSAIDTLHEILVCYEQYIYDVKDFGVPGKTLPITVRSPVTVSELILRVIDQVSLDHWHIHCRRGEFCGFPDAVNVELTWHPRRAESRRILGPVVRVNSWMLLIFY
jgi:hypothetical protein